jgi:acyl-coenzyme A thioesterase PaaI-like protein
MPESLRTKAMRVFYTWLFPAYRGTGGKITYLADDFREVRVKIPLGRRTRNYVGTIFGGSMYGAVDPICMVVLIKTLGPGYVVWDKSASIRFRKPGRSTLHARFLVDDAELDAIRDALKTERNDRVRKALIRALMKSGEGSEATLTELLSSSDPQVREAAVRGLAGAHSFDPWPWPWPRPRPFP